MSFAAEFKHLALVAVGLALITASFLSGTPAIPVLIGYLLLSVFFVAGYVVR